MVVNDVDCPFCFETEYEHGTVTKVYCKEHRRITVTAPTNDDRVDYLIEYFHNTDERLK